MHRPSCTFAFLGVILAIVAVVPLAYPATAPAEALSVFVDGSSLGGPCSDSRSATEAASPSTPWCGLATASKLAPDGSTVEVRAGEYPMLYVEDQPRSDFVTFRPFEDEQVTIAGIRTSTSSHFRFQDLTITGGVNLYFGSSYMQLLDSDLSHTGIKMRPQAAAGQGGYNGHLIEGNYVHDLDPGDWPMGFGLLISNGSSWDPVRGVTIRDNHFARIPVDAMYFGGRDFLIEGNEVEEVRRAPDRSDHADTIQILGADNVTIRNNFFHDNVHGIWAGRLPITNLVLENNVFANYQAFATQLSDAPGAKLVNNTYWNSGYGAALRNFDPEGTDGFEGAAMKDVVVANNIFEKFSTKPEYVAYEDHNLILNGTGAGLHDINALPTFVDAVNLDFELAPGSVGIDAGTSLFAPALDRLGRSRYDYLEVPNVLAGPDGAVDIGATESVPAEPDPSPPEEEEPPTETDPPKRPGPPSDRGRPPAPGPRLAELDSSSTGRLLSRVAVTVRLPEGTTAVGRRQLRLPPDCATACTASVLGTVSVGARRPRQTLHLRRARRSVAALVRDGVTLESSFAHGQRRRFGRTGPLAAARRLVATLRIRLQSDRGGRRVLRRTIPLRVVRPGPSIARSSEAASRSGPRSHRG